jgi:hypothetical protein
MGACREQEKTGVGGSRLVTDPLPAEVTDDAFGVDWEVTADSALPLELPMLLEILCIVLPKDLTASLRAAIVVQEGER